MPLHLKNPVYQANLADPFCFRHQDTYYMIGTGDVEADAKPTDGPVVPMIKSKDLQNWTSLGRVLIPAKDEHNGHFWAPEIATDGERFYLYYHASGNGGGFRIRVAVSDSPEGPYHDTFEPMTRLSETRNFAIDSHVFQDTDGQRYMYYATDFHDYDQTVFRGTAMVVDRMVNMTTLVGKPTLVMRAHWPWQLYQKDRSMAGVVADWYTLEGPTVLKRNGKYYLLYSGGCYQNDTYGVDYLIADHPLGPWKEVGKQRGPQLLRTMPGKVIGPGHNSVVTSPEGDDYIVYHAWNKEGTERQPWIDPLIWTKEGPKVERFADYIAQKNAEAAR